MKVYGIGSEGSALFYKGEALLRDRYPFFIPDLEEQYVAIPSLAVKIGRTGKFVTAKFAARYIEAIGVGWDITAQSQLTQLRSKGKPWDVAKAFDGSAVVFAWQTIDLSQEKTPLTVQCEERLFGFSIDQVFEGVELFSQARTIHKGDVLLFNATNVDQGITLRTESHYTVSLLSPSLTTELRVK